MNLFGKSKSEENISKNLPEWIGEMQENETRWIAFLEKLKVRMNELGEASIPELEASFAESGDDYTSPYHKMLQAINGQFNSMKGKAEDVKEEKIECFYDNHKWEVEHGTKEREMLDEFRTNNYKHFESFEEYYDLWIEKIEATKIEIDPEEKYQNIFNIYEGLKNKFNCSQCGSKLKIEKIYFLSTYIQCKHCQTQNTFDPGSDVKELEWVTRSVAEKRTQYMLDEKAALEQRDQDLYEETHNLKLDITFEKDKSKIEQGNKRISELEQEKQRCSLKAKEIYPKYLRAMFDEWHKLMPDMKDKNENVYQSLLDLHNRTNY